MKIMWSPPMASIHLNPTQSGLEEVGGEIRVERLWRELTARRSSAMCWTANAWRTWMKSPSTGARAWARC